MTPKRTTWHMDLRQLTVYEQFGWINIRAVTFSFVDQSSSYIYMAIPYRSPLKIVKKMERGRIQGLSNFCVPPIISGTGKATDFKFGEYIYRANPNKSPQNFRRKRSVGVSMGCQSFWVPPIISGTGKATAFRFCRNIHMVDRNKSP